jgi:hypothetical protein
MGSARNAQVKGIKVLISIGEKRNEKVREEFIARERVGMRVNILY